VLNRFSIFSAFAWVVVLIGFAVSFGPLLIGYRKPRRPGAAMALRH
jgi:uncharacterized protein involved in response to NO